MLDVAKRVLSGNASDRADAIARVQYPAGGIKDKACRVDNLSSLFPKGADFLGVPRHFQAIGYGKSELLPFDHLRGFVERVNGKSRDSGIFLFESFVVGLVVG